MDTKMLKHIEIIKSFLSCNRKRGELKEKRNQCGCSLFAWCKYTYTYYTIRASNVAKRKNFRMAVFFIFFSYWILVGMRHVCLAVAGNGSVYYCASSICTGANFVFSIGIVCHDFSANWRRKCKLWGIIY